MIIEGLLLTLEDEGSPHIAPMGPVVDRGLANWTFRPYQTSTTFQLLRTRGLATFHVIDDVLPIAKLVTGKSSDLAVTEIHGVPVIESACHWFQLEIVEWDVSSARSEARARVVHQGILRPFWGWNRAKHAVLEAAIWATRLHLVERNIIRENLQQLENAITKTAGDDERLAWQMITEYIASH